MTLVKDVIPKSEEGITMSKLCGALATDGTIYKQEKLWNGYKASSYYFELTDEWKDNVELIQKWVKALIDKEGSVGLHKGSLRYRIGSKVLVEYLHSLGFPYGEKTYNISVPNAILSLPREYKLAFVGSAIIFDGSVKLDGTIEFSSVSKQFRDQMVSILKKEKIHLHQFKMRSTKWSDSLKYGFSSRSFNFFMSLLEGPKKEKLELIRIGRRLSLSDLLKLFPEQEHSKLPFLKAIYKQIEATGSSIHFQELKRKIEEKHKITFHRNSLLVYLNLLVKSKLIKRNSIGWYSLNDNLKIPQHVALIPDGKTV